MAHGKDGRPSGKRQQVRYLRRRPRRPPAGEAVQRPDGQGIVRRVPPVVLSDVRNDQ